MQALVELAAGGKRVSRNRYHVQLDRHGRPPPHRYHVRWTVMDDLSHWVPPYTHKRLCDDAPIAGFNHATQVQVPTCLRCVVRR